MTRPTPVRSSQPAPYLGLSRDLGSHDVARRAEGARGGATCQQQRGCKQAESDGGGEAAFLHGGVSYFHVYLDSAGKVLYPLSERIP